MDEQPLNVQVPVQLLAELEAFIHSGFGSSRPKKLLVAAAVAALLRLSDEKKVNELIQQYRHQYLRQPNGGPLGQNRPASTAASERTSRPKLGRAG